MYGGMEVWMYRGIAFSLRPYSGKVVGDRMGSGFEELEYITKIKVFNIKLKMENLYRHLQPKAGDPAF